MLSWFTSKLDVLEELQIILIFPQDFIGFEMHFEICRKSFKQTMRVLIASCN